MRPGRLQRPKRVAFIVRGLPGSGKTLLSKSLREVEEREGGEPPRIHSLDDYFCTVGSEVLGAGVFGGLHCESC